jgi:hypothetical protein
VWHERRRGAAVAELGAGTDVGNQHVSLFSAGRAIHCRYTSFPQELLEMLKGVAAFAGQIGEVFTSESCLIFGQILLRAIAAACGIPK